MRSVLGGRDQASGYNKQWLATIFTLKTDVCGEDIMGVQKELWSHFMLYEGFVPVRPTYVRFPLFVKFGTM